MERSATAHSVDVAGDEVASLRTQHRDVGQREEEKGALEQPHLVEQGARGRKHWKNAAVLPIG